MNVQITIRSPDGEVNRQLGYFIANARTEDEQHARRPRGFFRRLFDAAINPDRPRWSFGGGDQRNNMPGFSFRYAPRAKNGPRTNVNQQLSGVHFSRYRSPERPSWRSAKPSRRQ
jgi:hypothetical protein